LQEGSRLTVVWKLARDGLEHVHRRYQTLDCAVLANHQRHLTRSLAQLANQFDHAV